MTTLPTAGPVTSPPRPPTPLACVAGNARAAAIDVTLELASAVTLDCSAVASGV